MAPSKFISDEEIVREFRERNERAVEDVARRYERFVYQVCRRVVRDGETARECVNDVWMRVWSSVPPDQPRNLEAYLSRIARAVAVDRLRAETRQKRGGPQRALADYDAFLSTEAGPDGFDAMLLGDLLNRFLSGLSARERVCFVKRFYYACTVREIADDTGISYITVRRLLNRVKKQLKALLQNEGYLS